MRFQRDAGGSRRDRKEGRSPGLGRLLLRWLPLLVLGAGDALSHSGWFPRQEMHEVAFGAFTLLVALILGFEGGDTIARKRPGARTLVSACPCQVQIPELERQIAELRGIVADYSAAWSAMSPSGSDDPPPSLSARRSRKTA